jgi:hypothetical protein
VSAPGLAGRRPAGRRGYTRRAGTAALVLAALAAGRAVTTLFPADAAISAPFVRPGAVGKPVSLRYAEVTATRVEGSTCVSTGFADGLRTPGVFVVVPLVIVSKLQPATLGYAAVQDRQGRTFLASGSRSSFSPGTGQPGVTRYASVVIELPRDAVAGAHLRIALNQLDQRRDDLADIDLGLSAADAARWTSGDTEIAVPDASDRPPAVPKPGPSCEVTA